MKQRFREWNTFEHVAWANRAAGTSISWQSGAFAVREKEGRFGFCERSGRRGVIYEENHQASTTVE